MRKLSVLFDFHPGVSLCVLTVDVIRVELLRRVKIDDISAMSNYRFTQFKQKNPPHCIFYQKSYSIVPFPTVIRVTLYEQLVS